MKRVVALLLLLASCTRAKSLALDPTHARANLVMFTFAIRSAANQCERHSRWMSGQWPDQADALAEECTRQLIVARDATVAAAEHAEPWTHESLANIACSSKSVSVALSNIRSLLAMHGAKVPDTVNDGILLGNELGRFANHECDPDHPRTTVTVTHD